MAHAFISYVHENEEAIAQLKSDLAHSGIETWTDSDLLPGHRWRKIIRQAIRDGVAFLACFSPEVEARNRTYMNEEITVAIDALREMRTDRAWFIPVLLAPCEIPDRDIGGGETLRDIQWVKLYPDWNAGVKRIVHTIRAELKYHQPPPQSPDEPRLPPLRNAPSAKTLGAWKSVWRTLLALKFAGGELIQYVDEQTIEHYAECLRKAIETVGETAFFFDKSDFQQLDKLLQYSLNFRIGKERLVQLRRRMGNRYGDRLSPRMRDRIRRGDGQQEIEWQIEENRSNYEQLCNLIQSMQESYAQRTIANQNAG